MIIKLIPARDATSLFEYLAGEGKHNEHVDQRVIYNNQAPPAEAAVPITKKDAKNLATDFETYIKEYGSTRTFKSNRKGAKNSSRDKLNLYHGVISLDPDETPPSDETWAKIVDRYSTLMGWQEPDGNYAPVIAIAHGKSAGGSPHIHFAVSTVMANGQMIPESNWKRRSIKAKRKIEDEFGLKPIETERAGYSHRDWKQAEEKRRKVRGRTVKESRYLQRAVASTALAANSEQEFAALLRISGLDINPRFGKGGKVTGYAVKIKGDPECPWYAAGKLSRHLTLPALRQDQGWEKTTNTEAGRLQWEKGYAISFGAPPPLSKVMPDYARRIRAFSRTAPTSPAWATRAREAGSVLAAMSMRIEKDQPGKLWQAALTLYRAGETARRQNPTQVMRESKMLARTLLISARLTRSNTNRILAASIIMAGHLRAQKQLQEQYRAANQIHEVIRQTLTELQANPPEAGAPLTARPIADLVPQSELDKAINAGRIIYTKGKNIWLIKGKNLTPGQVVTVTRNDGEQDQVRVGQVTRKNKAGHNWATFTNIPTPAAPRPASGGQVTPKPRDTSHELEI